MKLVLAALLLPSLALAAAPTPEGIWLGTLDAGASGLRIAFHVTRSADGKLTSTMDSLSQNARGIVIEKTTFASPTLRLELPKLGITFEGKVSGDDLIGTYVQGKSLPLSMKRVASIDPPKRPQEPKRPFPYREEEISLRVPASYSPQRASASASVSLAGTLTIPEGKGPFPAVLFITGSGPEDRDETIFDHKPFLIISDALSRAGIATLRFDDRGTGKSEGSQRDLTTLDLAQDALAELGVLDKRVEIDRRAIGVIGHSEGGLIAPIVATQSAIPKFLVLLAGTGMNGVDVLRLQIAAAMRVAGKSEAEIERRRAANEKIWPIVIRETDPKKIEQQARDALASDPEVLKEVLPELSRVNPWLRMFLKLDPIPYLKKVKIPVLAMNGTLDLQVDASNLPFIESALKAAGNHDVTIAAMPGLNHLFQHAKTGAVSEYADIEETFAPDAIAKIRAFILAHAKR